MRRELWKVILIGISKLFKNIGTKLWGDILSAVWGEL